MISGIPGSATDHHARAVLDHRGVRRRLPDASARPRRLRDASRPIRGAVSEVPSSSTLRGCARARRCSSGSGAADLLYSFGAGAPGRGDAAQPPALHAAAPRATTASSIDLAAIDILRSRERGVPRYNEFRRLLHLPAPGVVRGARRRTRRRPRARARSTTTIEDVDLTVGHARREAARGVRLQRHRVPHLRPDGVAAAQERPVLHHRLHPAVYTPEGMRWIDDNDMSSVLMRHYPELAPALRGVHNPFAPWS